MQGKGRLLRGRPYEHDVGPPMKNAELTVDIDDLALPSDYGVARVEGRIVFVPRAVPGDRLKIGIIKENRNALFGKILSAETPSADRTTPSCPHFGACGGCIMQHTSYEKQIDLKRRFLAQSLSRIGRIDIHARGPLSIHPSPDRYHYRNKIELAFGEERGTVILGMRARVSPFQQYTPTVVPIETCPIFSAHLHPITTRFLEFFRRQSYTAYNPLTRKGVLRRLILRGSQSTGEIMVIIESSMTFLPNSESLVRTVTANDPNITSVYHATNRRADGVTHFDRIERLFGRRWLTDTVAGLSVRVYPYTFIQPNIKGAALLYGQVLEELDLNGTETVLGLYSGSGPLEMFLSRRAQRVLGIDSEKTNITSARLNCADNDIRNCTFHQSRVEDVRGRVGLPHVDVVVVDPPRAGLTKNSLTFITGLRAQKIAYVSCNPATLARDLRQLLASGYTIHHITGFDFFPHTGHLETLVILRHS